MRRWAFAAILAVAGCGRSGSDPAAILGTGDLQVVDSPEELEVMADVPEGSGVSGTNFLALPIGTKVEVVGDDGPRSRKDRLVRVVVAEGKYRGPAAVRRDRLRSPR